MCPPVTGRGGRPAIVEEPRCTLSADRVPGAPPYHADELRGPRGETCNATDDHPSRSTEQRACTGEECSQGERSLRQTVSASA